MELYNGRPEHTEGRLEKELRVYDLLDSLGVSYERVDHEAAMTMDACEEIDRTLSEGVEEGVSICKNLLLCNRQETDFYLLLIPGDKPFKTKYLYLDITPGSLSVMGLMNDHEGRVRLLIDEDVLKPAYFACHPCINTSSLRFATKDLTDKVIPAMDHEPTIVKL